MLIVWLERCIRAEAMFARMRLPRRGTYRHSLVSHYDVPLYPRRPYTTINPTWYSLPLPLFSWFYIYICIYVWSCTTMATGGQGVALLSSGSFILFRFASWTVHTRPARERCMHFFSFVYLLRFPALRLLSLLLPCQVQTVRFKFKDESLSGHVIPFSLSFSFSASFEAIIIITYYPQSQTKYGTLLFIRTISLNNFNSNRGDRIVGVHFELVALLMRWSHCPSIIKGFRVPKSHVYHLAVVRESIETVTCPDRIPRTPSSHIRESFVNQLRNTQCYSIPHSIYIVFQDR